MLSLMITTINEWFNIFIMILPQRKSGEKLINAVITMYIVHWNAHWCIHWNTQQCNGVTVHYTAVSLQCSTTCAALLRTSAKATAEKLVQSSAIQWNSVQFGENPVQAVHKQCKGGNPVQRDKGGGGAANWPILPPHMWPSSWWSCAWWSPWWR